VFPEHIAGVEATLGARLLVVPVKARTANSYTRYLSPMTVGANVRTKKKSKSSGVAAERDAGLALIHAGRMRPEACQLGSYQQNKGG
jgi:hypothetical protein